MIKLESGRESTLCTCYGEKSLRRVVNLAKKNYESKTEALIQPLIDANHFELVDVEYVKEAGNWYLRAYIDKELSLIHI